MGYQVSLKIEATAYIDADWPEDVIEDVAIGSVSLEEPIDPAVKIELEWVGIEDIVGVEN